MSNEEKQQEIVTIDGPSGVGKSTVSRKLAALFGFTYLDTGAMYRGVAWYLCSLKVSLDDEQAIDQKLDDLELELLPASSATGDDVGVLVNGRDVSHEIRTPEITMAASKVSALAVVRSRLTALQQQWGKKGLLVAEGRDTGTVVFPGAAYKFYLDADLKERARRRVQQLRDKGQEFDEDLVMEQLCQRDKNDSGRALAPLKKAADAYLVDTTRITIDQVIETIAAKIEEKRKAVPSSSVFSQ